MEILNGVEVTVDGIQPRHGAGTSWGARGRCRRRWHRHGGGRRARRATRRPRSQPQPARSDAFTLANMVEGVTKGFEKRLRIVGVGYRAAMKGPTSSCRGLLARGARAQPDGSSSRSPHPRRSWSGATTSSSSARRPPTSGRSASPSRTRARASVTRTSTFGRRPGRPRRGDGLMDAKTRRAARVRRHARPQDDRRHRSGAPGRVPVQPAHLRAADRRPRGRDARIGLRRGGRWRRRQDRECQGGRQADRGPREGRRSTGSCSTAAGVSTTAGAAVAEGARGRTPRSDGATLRREGAREEPA